MRLQTLLAVLYLFAVILPTAADDTLATLGTGGLVFAKSQDIEMESEDLQISAREIKIRYVFINHSNKDIESVIAFPLPTLDGGLLYNSPVEPPVKNRLNFVDFHVSANGKEIAPSVEARAFDGQKDITPRLNSLGLPVNVFLEPFNRAILRIPQAERSQLEKEQLIVHDDYNPPLKGIGSHGWWPTWSMRVRYYWRQPFPAGTRVELIQTYKPVVGGGYLVKGSDEGSFGQYKEHCGGSAAVQYVKNANKTLKAARSGTILLERNVKFILLTGNNWVGPIGQFKLTVETEDPRDFVMTCSVPLKKTGPKTYLFMQPKFRPSRDLDLLTLHPIV